MPSPCRPNILWLCTEHQRFDTIHALGNPHIRTPNLDRLVREGVALTHAYSQSSVCTPSRASFLTGRYPVTTGCRQNGQDIGDHEIPITRTLRDLGYDENADRLGEAVVSTLESKDSLTPDLGGTGTTRAMVDSLMRHLPE